MSGQPAVLMFAFYSSAINNRDGALKLCYTAYVQIPLNLQSAIIFTFSSTLQIAYSLCYFVILYVIKRKVEFGRFHVEMRRRQHIFHSESFKEGRQRFQASNFCFM
jgi:hypothetical protein